MNYITKVVVIDDDKPSVNVLVNELENYKDVNVVATAFNSSEGELALFKYRPQLLFLDIELPNITGLEFLTVLRLKIDWEMEVVFYTSYEKYMLQALRLQAFDFLLKPVSKDDLLLVMNRFNLKKTPRKIPALLNSFYPTDKPLLITTITNDRVVLRPQNIGYFRYNSERKLWEIVLDDFQHIILKHHTTSDVILNYGMEFIQIHKTYIININYLGMVQDNTCIMLYPFNAITELKISKMYRKKLFDKFYSL